jgi:hypothetical protein
MDQRATLSYKFYFLLGCGITNYIFFLACHDKNISKFLYITFLHDTSMYTHTHTHIHTKNNIYTYIKYMYIYLHIHDTLYIYIFIHPCSYKGFEPKTSWRCIKVCTTKSLQNFDDTKK